MEHFVDGPLLVGFGNGIGFRELFGEAWPQAANQGFLLGSIAVGRRSDFEWNSADGHLKQAVAKIPESFRIMVSNFQNVETAVPHGAIREGNSGKFSPTVKPVGKAF